MPLQKRTDMQPLEIISASLIDWSRAQFALTAAYHWLFVPLTLGLALIMAIMESVYVRTNDEFWKAPHNSGKRYSVSTLP